MDSFIMEIAQLPIAVSCHFGSTREYFRRYLTEQGAQCSIEILPDDLQAEQRFLDLEADQVGLRRRKFTEPFLERTAIMRKAAALLLPRNVLLLHGSTVAVDGVGYLFTARCGTGKSTHTRFWKELLGERAIMVNDDRAFLQFGHDQVLVYGSPWSGKHGIDTNLCVPFGGLCILERGTENRMERISAEEAYSFLLGQVYNPTDESVPMANELTAELVKRVPVWKMWCTKSIEAARMSYSTMSENAYFR